MAPVISSEYEISRIRWLASDYFQRCLNHCASAISLASGCFGIFFDSAQCTHVLENFADLPIFESKLLQICAFASPTRVSQLDSLAEVTRYLKENRQKFARRVFPARVPDVASIQRKRRVACCFIEIPARGELPRKSRAFKAAVNQNEIVKNVRARGRSKREGGGGAEKRKEKKQRGRESRKQKTRGTGEEK
ncbi:hypothetical protein K0M31_013990 [Melipona bicolor]|uniref:Uncharacterized protein n=1 Tax=Melipona bicolor TaxID=60889 RepID=A0AA40G8C5_9HYME|nr:hypothetical protein K0M31_013990 [Melipona bicolor]